jgi:hypothetical protein
MATDFSINIPASRPARRLRLQRRRIGPPAGWLALGVSGGAALFGRACDAALFDELQERTPALRRIRFLRSRFIGQHRIAQRLQLRVLDAIELHPKFEDGDRHQDCRLAIAHVQERAPALLEACENRMQFFF